RQAYFHRAHDDRSPEGIAFVYDRTGGDSIINQQYLRDVPPERREIMSPDAWTSDLGFLATEKDRKIQVQLLQDYQNNIDRYPAWQAMLREHQFPALIVGQERPGLHRPGRGGLFARSSACRVASDRRGPFCRREETFRDRRLCPELHEEPRAVRIRDVEEGGLADRTVMSMRSILITGCSSGIGLASAREMKARGWRVFATARKEQDIAKLRDEVGVDSLYLDYAEPRSIAEAAEQVLKATDGKLTA